MKSFNVFIKLILIVLIILFGVYVWPTPYKYMPNIQMPSYNFLGGESEGRYLPFRIHRITGKGEVYMNGRWKKN